MDCLNMFIWMIVVLQLYTVNGQRIYFAGEERVQTRVQRRREPLTAPTLDFDCGDPYVCAVYMGILKNGTSVHLYALNKTASKYEKLGYKIKINEVEDDYIKSFTYSKGRFSETLEFDYIAGVRPAGGEPAEPERAQYMAQLGEKIGENITFQCDGVLINEEWVLSAAHCFTDPNFNANIIRLGDYDTSQPTADDFTVHGKHVWEYPIKDIFFHPKFKIKERYNDLVLIPLGRKIPKYPTSISPICLPWNHLNENLRDKAVVLTGWGATQFGGVRTPVLQQVKLTVFNPSRCESSYKNLPFFSRRYPKGFTDDNILCVGWEEDGKDACKGDSGAPVELYKPGRVDFELIGIVSGGYGCGLRDYPGLYIPINNEFTLRWIKETAF